MKLGEALALRADLQKRMHQVHTRLLENASVQEGDVPAIEPRALIDEYRRVAREHEDLVRRINHTNIGVRIVVDDDDVTLADAVVRRERIAREAKLLRELASHASPKQNRWLRTELKHVPAIDVAGVLTEADALSKTHRELDTRIQQANWDAELIE